MKSIKTQWCIITLLLFLSSIIYGQDKDIYAGPDQTICKGTCITLGSTPEKELCYEWKDEKGAVISKKSMITICEEDFDDKATFSLVVTEGTNLIAEENVTVFESQETLDLSIYDAKVLLGKKQNYLSITEKEEETSGAQTFVNIDNDDNDNQYDNIDNDVTIKDDELIKVVLRSSKDQVSLKVTKGENNVQFYEDEMKKSPFDINSNITLSSLNNGIYEKELWIEGITAHHKQRGTIIELSSPDNTISCIDRISITIIGTRRILWNGNNNGYQCAEITPCNTLDIDPNFPTNTALKGYRVFPGARANDVNKANDLVNFDLFLTPAPVRAMSIYVKTFDIDDPSDDTKFIDPNDDISTLSGDYSGKVGLSFDEHNDNRGLVQGHKFGFMNGQDSNGIKKIDFNKDEQVKTIDFKVSHHPGDNYRLAANPDIDFIKNLENRDHIHKMLIVDKNVKDKSIPSWEHHTSPVLTVWRLLHIESESMPNFEYGPYTQQIATYMTDFLDFDVEGSPQSPPYNANQMITAIFSSSIVDPFNQGNISYGKGRFQDGYAIFGAEDYNGTNGLVSASLNRNYHDAIIFNQPQSIAGLNCEITAPNMNTINATVDNIISSAVTPTLNNYTWTLSLPNNIDLNDYAGGQIRVGGDFAGIWIYISEIVNSNSINTLTLSIPVLVRDDDASPEDNLLPSTMELSTTIEAFSKAYILPIDDFGGMPNNPNTPSFMENVPLNIDAALDIKRDSKFNETDLFWVSYFVMGWQFAQGYDADPNIGTFLLDGVTATTSHNSALSKGGHISLFFEETYRDHSLFPNYTSPAKANIIAHEMGHQFGLTHGNDTYDFDGDGTNDMGDTISEYPNIGLMRAGDNTLNDSTVAPEDYFIPRHINLMRSRVKSPGQP